jgi:hypothetical protein
MAASMVYVTNRVTPPGSANPTSSVTPTSEWMPLGEMLIPAEMVPVQGYLAGLDTTAHFTFFCLQS